MMPGNLGEVSATRKRVYFCKREVINYFFCSPLLRAVKNMLKAAWGFFFPLFLKLSVREKSGSTERGVRGESVRAERSPSRRSAGLFPCTANYPDHLLGFSPTPFQPFLFLRDNNKPGWPS